jgi:hypothetical protein
MCLLRDWPPAAATTASKRRAALSALDSAMHLLDAHTARISWHLVLISCYICCCCSSCCPAGKVGAEVVEAACIIELPALKGRAKLGDTKLFVLIEKEGE